MTKFVKLLTMKNNCSEVTLYDFIHCVFKNDYTVLLDANETCTNDELITRWNEIYEEYCKLMDNHQYFIIFDCMKEIIRLQDVILHASAAVNVLMFVYDKEQIPILKSYDIDFDDSTTDLYQKSIEKARKVIKNLNFQLALEVKKFNKLQENKGQSQTESEFMQGIAIIGKFMGFRLPIKETTLMEFAGYVKLNNTQPRK